MIIITEEKVINLTVEEFAFLVRRCVSTIYHHLRDGKLKSYQIGQGPHAIPSTELAKYGVKLFKEEEYI